MPFRRLLALILATVASASSASAHVKVSLVAAERSIQPGRPFTVALRLEHEPHWHTYWINAGTGYPTSLAWELPAGWSAGEIQWPTPIAIVDSHGVITGNGYEGVAFLPVVLTPPVNLAPGTTVTLKAQAGWLMCADICVPGEATVELVRPVDLAPPTPDPAIAASLRQIPLPSTPTGVTFIARRAEHHVSLAIDGLALGQPRFFSTDGVIQYDLPQTVTAHDRTTTLVLPLSESAEPNTARLLGVVAYTDAAGVYRGLAVDVPLERGPVVAAGTRAVPAPAPLLGTLLLALVGGLILNLMPCVFPVLGIKILGFVNQAGHDRRKVALHGLTFTAGVLLSFWTLAATLAVLRAGGDQLGWGFQLQSASFVFSLTVVMLVFALSLSGVFEFGLSATGVGTGLQMKEGYSGSFFTGVLATVVATPCSAPFLAPALGAALALPVIESFAVFTAIAVGLSIPYLLLSIFPQATKALPRPGVWMETFKQAMAFPLYATVGYLIWVLAGQIGESSLLLTFFGFTLVAMAAWFYGRYALVSAPPARRRFGQFGGAALLALGVWLGWPHPPATDDIVWEPWSPERVVQLQNEGRTVYVDFTARWCATCQANKKIVFSNTDVKSVFRTLDVATLKADWTNRDPRITAELAKWERSAVPFNLVYLPGRSDPVVLPELLTPGIVLDALHP